MKAVGFTQYLPIDDHDSSLDVEIENETPEPFGRDTQVAVKAIAVNPVDAEVHLVDERIDGHKPKSLSHAESAALPLAIITGFEACW